MTKLVILIVWIFDTLVNNILYVAGSTGSMSIRPCHKDWPPNEWLLFSYSNQHADSKQTCIQLKLFDTEILLYRSKGNKCKNVTLDSMYPKANGDWYTKKFVSLWYRYGPTYSEFNFLAFIEGGNLCQIIFIHPCSMLLFRSLGKLVV